jgi:hypothetical protein
MWDYIADIWTLSTTSGWESNHGRLIYTDGQIGKVLCSDGQIRIAPLHCIYVQVPMVWFLSQLTIRKPTSGTYGSDFIQSPNRKTAKPVKQIGKSDEEEFFG